MKIGLIGLHQTGKTTLFELLCGRGAGAATSDKKSANLGIGLVPDARIDFLSDLYKPKKTTYARIEFTDVNGFSVSDGKNDNNGSGSSGAGISGGISGGGNGNSGAGISGNSGSGSGSSAAKFLNDVRPCDALIHVLRAFDSKFIIHDLGFINPARDLEAVETEILFADLEMIEKRINRIKAGKKVSKTQTDEITLLERCYAQLENGGAIHDIILSNEESAIINTYEFLTEKPRLAVVNTDEHQWTSGTYPNSEEINSLCSKLQIPLITLCAEMELEISRLPEEDKKPFLDDLGIEQPGIATLARAVYGLLGLISFITVGEDEVRAWTIEKGINAKTAASKIHSDIERGFIRAEVVKYDDIKELGNMAKVKEKGLFRLEGKEYIVADGDIISFRFNV